MNEPSQQIDASLNVIPCAKDQPLGGKKLLDVVVNALHGCGQVRIDSYGTAKIVTAADSKCCEHVFLTAAVTFLGGNGNHPLFKKRIQLPRWFKKAHSHFSGLGRTVHFLGVYHFNGNIVFVDFDPTTYVKRRMNNSSAFVYINDLFRAMQDGVAVRIDLHGNKLTTVRKESFGRYVFGEECDAEASYKDLTDKFTEFNSRFPFNDWISGKTAIRQMRRNNWPQWKQTEWAGWFLEYLFSKYLSEHGVKIIEYHGTDRKRRGDLDFDLFFPAFPFCGDLKASDERQKETPGNDMESFSNAILRYGRFWYIIYEHATVKDRDCGRDVTHFRARLIAKTDNAEPLNEDALNSNWKRMKNRVCFKRMTIIELNRSNCSELLTVFLQGRQRNGSPRKPKFCINKRNIENFQIYHYEIGT